MRARPVLALTSIGLVLTVATGSASAGPAAQRATNDGAIHSDFDGDGYDDLAVASPSEKAYDGAAQAGIVHILYGGPNGLTGEGSQMLHQGSPGMAGDPEERDFLGLSLAAGDFDGDSRADLAIGVPREDLNGKADAGLVQILYGSTGGLVATEYFTYANTTGQGTCTCRFGEALAAGDFNEDGVADLAIGAPLTPRRGFYESGDVLGRESGEVVVVYGKHGADGLRANDSTRLLPQRSWLANVTLLQGNGIDFLEFGAALAAGDRDGDGDTDLAVGVPGYGLIGSITSTELGAFAIFDGSLHGVKTTSAVGGALSFGLIDRNRTGDLSGDRFGESLAFGDFDGNGKDDLVVGAARESVGPDDAAGSVYVYEALELERRWTQNLLAGAESDADDLFGYSLRTGDFAGDGRDDLAIGAPFENFSGSTNAGIVHVLRGSSSGLKASTAKIFHQDKPGIAGAAETGDTFARALGVGNFNGDIQGTRGRDDLAIGVPNEKVAGKARAGLVHVLFGSSSGVTATGSQTWTQDSPGIADQVGIGDNFGGSLP
jgi:hypothetical protein